MNTELGRKTSSGIALTYTCDEPEQARSHLAGLGFALGALLALGGCGGGEDMPPSPSVGQGPPAAAAPVASPTSPPGTPSAVPPSGSSPAVPAPADPALPATELSGTWEYVGNNAGETSAYEFHGNGTFSFYSRFTGIATIVEEGRYSVRGSEVTVVPERKLYNGEVTPPGDARTYGWRVQPDPYRDGELLILTLEGGIPNEYHRKPRA